MPATTTALWISFDFRPAEFKSLLNQQCNQEALSGSGRKNSNAVAGLLIEILPDGFVGL
jgi:hypothetical protein